MAGDRQETLLRFVNGRVSVTRTQTRVWSVVQRVAKRAFDVRTLQLHQSSDASRGGGGKVPKVSVFFGGKPITITHAWVMHAEVFVSQCAHRQARRVQHTRMLSGCVMIKTQQHQHQNI